MAQRQNDLKLPADYARKIAETFNWKLSIVDEMLEFTEDKEGYFWATLKPNKRFDKPDFVTMCRLTRDLGEEDFLKGARAWKVPGPMAKKGPTGPQEKPSGHGIDSQVAYKEPRNAIPTGPSGVTPDSVKMNNSKPPQIPNIRFIPVDAVQIPSFLPIRALISNERLGEIRQSIKKHGLKYPIKVRPGSDPNTYELIDGYLRLKSVQQLDWKEVPAEITPASDQQVVIDSIVTNKDRIEEDPITVAKKLDILVNAFGWTQEKLAEELGVDQATVSHHIRLLRLPEEVQHYVALHSVSFSHALLLLTLEDPKLQVQLANEVVSKALSTRQLEERILEAQPKPEAPEIPEKHEVVSKTVTAGSRSAYICARCGEPIEGTPVDLGGGKFYDADCAEQVSAESQPGAIREDHVGSFGPELVRLSELGHVDTGEDRGATGAATFGTGEKVSGPVPIGTFQCTECQQHFIIEHLPNGKHKLKQIRSVEG